MNSRSALKATVLAVCLSAPFAMSSQELALKRGVYVLKGVDCKDPPFAAMKSWDGIGFSGPHSTECTTQEEPSRESVQGEHIVRRPW